MIDVNPRRFAVVTVALFLSLGINLFLGGLMLGREIAGGVAPTPVVAHPGPPEGFGGRVQRLPEAQRRAFWQAMRPYRSGIEQARASLTEARGHLNVVLLADTYDPAAMTEALARVRVATDLLQQRVQDATAQALAVLSPDGRQRLAAP